MLGKTWGIASLLVLTLLVSILVLPSTQAAQPSQKELNQAFKSLKSYLYVKPDATRTFVDAKAYVLVDGQNGNVLLDSNADQKRPIGSTTKMVTALVASQKYKPTDILTITQAAASINGSKVGLKAGTKMTFDNLVQGLLIPSGNDIAYGLADAFAKKEGDPALFVEQMNKFVEANHLKNTHFGDPAGLDDEGMSTAFDLAQIGRLLLNNPELTKVVGTSSATISAEDGTTYPLQTTDQLLKKDSPYYNPDVIGIKTGFTPAAGYCLVAAEHFKNHILIGVVLGVPGTSETSSAAKIQTLFRWADQNIDVANY